MHDKNMRGAVDEADQRFEDDDDTATGQKALKQSKAQQAARVLWTGACAGGVLLVLRLLALRPELDGLRPVEMAKLIAQGVWQDWLLLLGLTYVVLSLLRGLSVPALRRLTGGVYALGVGLLILWGAVNIAALRMLGAPITADWVAYSDIAHTDVLFDSLPHVVSGTALLAVFVLLASVFGGGRVLAARRSGGAIVLMALYGVSVILGLAVASTPVTATSERLVNPLVAFVRSMGAGTVPDALNGLPVVPPDVQAFPAVPGLTPPAAPNVPLRNVVFYAYESTPARQTQGWGAPYDVTPNLAAALGEGLAFDRAYAHVPASNYFLVSAFTGIIPELSSTSMTSNGTADGLPSLPQVLADAGMRTAFFNSSDNRFQNTEGFVSSIGFEHVVDYRDWTCETGVFEVESVTDRFRNTSSDLCTVDQMTLWLDDLEEEEPFFLAFRTGMTHYPYFPGEAPEAYVEDEAYNRYLNALRVGDEAFGLLLDYLRENGLMEETLIVVMGDHGEAFGEHGTYVHAAGIYEENVHVPMALINPQLFSGARSDLIVGISDVAATITDLLDLPTPVQWEGKSVFAAERPDGVLFFAPWNGFQIGYRSGDRKLITNANTGDVQLFDLNSDPLEATNLSTVDPEGLAEAKITLSRAVSAHQGFLNAVLAGEAPPQPVARRTDVVLTVSGTALGEAPKAWVFLDGEEVGSFDVSSAPDTGERAATREDVEAAFMEVRLPILLDSCAKELQVYFVNDAWAGEGQTGDIDLWIRRVQVGAQTYRPGRFVTIEDRAGGLDGEDFRFYRNGGISIGLDLSPECLGEVLASDSR